MGALPQEGWADGRSMFKRVSLVWKREDLSEEAFRTAWMGEHVQLALGLPRLREYTIDFVTNSAPGSPDGIATLRFDNREDYERAFATPGLRDDLIRTRDDFASSVQVLYVDERVVHRDLGEVSR